MTAGGRIVLLTERGLARGSPPERDRMTGTELRWLAHYDEGVPASLAASDETLVDFFAATVARFSDRPALAFLNAELSYAELADEVARCATALTRLGVEPGTSVAIQLPNLPQTVIAFYAAISIGARVVMTNPLYTPREVEHQWNDADCKVAIVTDFNWKQKLEGVRAKVGIEHWIVAAIPEYLGFPLRQLAPLKLRKEDPPLWAKFDEEPMVHRFRKLVRRTPASPPAVALDRADVAVLQYTGGTTGPSKGAMLTHANLASNVEQINAWFTGVRYGQEVMLTCLPLFHVFGLTVAMNWAVRSGAKMVLLPNPRDFKTLVKSIEKHRVTLFPGVPALFNGLNNHPGIENVDVRSIRSCFSGSAPIAPDVLERFEELTGARIIEGFGMSETSPVTHVNPLHGVRKVGTVGIPVSDTEARCIDLEDGHELPPGEEGELVVRGPQVMAGYWNRPDETENVLEDGWMHTGDLAIMDEDGYFRIVGRKKDMINCGGLKVFPDEVDAILMAHESILEAATIGVPDERRGETVKSFIVLQPGATLAKSHVEAWCRENLAAYKVPREIEFLEELPKSSVMKVLRRELRDRESAG